jgi:aconitate hydratase
MGQAPATGKISLRTVPRNFPGRSGTKGDQVYLCSPETSAASALTGRITDPRTLGFAYPRFTEPDTIGLNTTMLVPPEKNGSEIELEKGPNIEPLPDLDPLPDNLEGPVALKVGDDVSTDEIMPAGTRVLLYRSNIPEISKFVFEQVDATYYDRVMKCRDSGSFIVGGKNYGQGSSREHAALAPRYLGVKAVLAKSFARIHLQNLVNFGIVPLEFSNPGDYERVDRDDVLEIVGIRSSLKAGRTIEISNSSKAEALEVRHALGPRQIEIILQGSLINVVRNEERDEKNR